MEVSLGEEWLLIFHNTLVGIYRETEYPITIGYSRGMINVCVERPLTWIYNKIPFPHLLHKAAVLMETIIKFHPFADGNKRVALLATFYFLYWNGYDLIIPEDADQFTIEIAKGKHNLNDILSWLTQHCKRHPLSIFRNWLIGASMNFWEHRIDGVLETLVPFFVPFYPFTFFFSVIARKKEKII